MIRLNAVDKFFNRGKQNEIHVIDHVSLDLPERGMVAIFGRSGCGKTTLLNVIGGLDSFGSGGITVNGQDIRTDTDTLRNRSIGYIFQNYNLNMAESCFDNVADALRLCGISDPDTLETRVMAALSNVGMDKYRSRTPDTLSGGQQQRIAIARAIVKNPGIILADEPTGNLDEANTLLIMELLRRIADDHLVLLVTHEANLVDSYCDKVIELGDGRVLNIRENESVNGIQARDRNDIFLGELTHSAGETVGTAVEFYGEPPAEPVKLTFVSSGGRLYLRIDSKAVQILDDSSEIRLREGVFEGAQEAAERKANIDMSKLPPFEGSHYGRLFTFRASLRSGYAANFRRQKKKGQKLLRICMALFSAVLVLTTAIFGTAFKDIAEAHMQYNRNVFYVFTPDGAVSERLHAALESPDSGIDSVAVRFDTYPQNADQLDFAVASFESFHSYESNFSTHAVCLDLSLAKGLPLEAGKSEGLADNEILLSTASADQLLEASTVGYIRTYEDLLGLICTSVNVRGEFVKVAGIVRSDEIAAWMTPMALALRMMENCSSHVLAASECGLDAPKPGEAALMIRWSRESEVTYPKIGETVNINGCSFRVSRICDMDETYAQWLINAGMEKPDIDAWMQTKYLELYGKSITPGSPDYDMQIAPVIDTYYFEYYDMYYAEFDAYLKDVACMYIPDNWDDTSLMYWLFTEKGLEDARWYFIGDEAYRAACLFREANGKLPAYNELLSSDMTFPDTSALYEQLKIRYREEFDNSHNKMYYSHGSWWSEYYAVSDADYIKLSTYNGETSPSATEKIFAEDDWYWRFRNCSYTAVHANDVKKADAWIKQNFASLEAPNKEVSAVYTPDMLYEELIADIRGDIIRNFVAMAVILAVMCVCMYFIMRASLMSRIREVGIYRAIGVSKKNLVFRFLVEAGVLTTLTVFVGYIFSSALLMVWLANSQLIIHIFYFPLWLALALLAVLYAVSLFCGTLPILLLLRKTPSEILAKYDI